MLILGDFGKLGEYESTSPYVDTKRYTQVYSATHDGDTLLQPRYRSFISFSFGGRNIEDWNLISVTPGDRIERNVYSEFEDLTSEYDVLDGHFYWGTHLKGKTISFTIATDEITEAQLNDFAEWFRPGVTRELILAETPNRMIRARVSEAPVYNFLGFEKQETIEVGDRTFDTSITAYRGRITLTFVSESPFWEAVNYIITDNAPSSDWDIAERIKVMVDDEIPTQYSVSGVDFYSGDMDNSIVNSGESGSLVDVAIVGSGRVGPIIESLIKDGVSTAVLPKGSSPLLYYCGTAPGKPVIQFRVPIEKDNDTKYILAPWNSFTEGKEPYNTFSIGSSSMRFTLPSLYMGYNKAIKIFNESENKSIAEVRAQLLTDINEYYSRAYATGVLNNLETQKQTEPGTSLEGNDDIVAFNIIITAEDVTQLVGDMTNFIPADATALFIFDSEKGTTTALMDINLISGESVSVKENAGDMMRSNYILIRDRNICSTNKSPNKYIVTAENCQAISTNYPKDLQNFYIQYKILYR